MNSSYLLINCICKYQGHSLLKCTFCGVCIDIQSLTIGKGIIYAPNVHGALIELEKWVPTAGLAMVQMFFPTGLKYREERIRDNIHKKFWKRAYFTRDVRNGAEEKRKSLEREQKPGHDDRLDGTRRSPSV
jgi:hypothetical protein